MNQSLRNKIYAVATGLFGILVVLGVVDQATSDEATTFLDQGLEIAGQAIAFGTALLAFVKSLPSRTATIDVPKNDVAEVVTPDGTVLAGPASPLPDGTVLSDPKE